MNKLLTLCDTKLSGGLEYNRPLGCSGAKWRLAHACAFAEVGGRFCKKTDPGEIVDEALAGEESDGEGAIGCFLCSCGNDEAVR